MSYYVKYEVNGKWYTREFLHWMEAMNHITWLLSTIAHGKHKMDFLKYGKEGDGD